MMMMTMMMRRHLFASASAVSVAVVVVAMMALLTVPTTVEGHQRRDAGIGSWSSQPRTGRSAKTTQRRSVSEQVGAGLRFRSEQRAATEADPAKEKAGMQDTNGLAKKIVTTDDTKCIICQYLTERIRGEMLMNGLSGGVPYGNGPPLVGVPRFSAGGMSSNVASPGNMFTPPVGGQVGGASSFLEEGEERWLPSAISKLKSAVGNKMKRKKDTEGYPVYQKDQKLGIRRNFFQMKKMAKESIPYPRHDRMLNLRHWGPVQTRYSDMYDGPLRAARRAQERFENNQMYTVIYDVLNQICSGMPPPFYQYCAPIIRNYQKVGEGLRYKDRPDAICMHINACNEKSYIRKSPHALLSE